jgi:hypothetical protein
MSTGLFSRFFSPKSRKTRRKGPAEDLRAKRRAKL